MSDCIPTENPFPVLKTKVRLFDNIGNLEREGELESVKAIEVTHVNWFGANYLLLKVHEDGSLDFKKTHISPVLNLPTYWGTTSHVNDEKDS